MRETIEEPDATEAVRDAEAVVREAAVQLEVTKILANLPDRKTRARVLNAVRALFFAEAAVPGVVAAFLKGLP